MQQKLLCHFVFVAGLAGLPYGQRITIPIPGGSYYDMEPSDAACHNMANEFQKEFRDANGDSPCATSGRRWSVYAAGYVGSFFEEIKGSTGLNQCLQLSGQQSAGQPRDTAQAMCRHVDSMTNACICDQLFCVNDQTNREIDPEELNRCREFGKKMCVHFSDAISSACRGVVYHPATGTGVRFDQSLVPRECDQSQCRSAASTASRGVYLAAAAAVGALAFAML